MIPLTIDEQIKRQIQKGCKSSKLVIENYLKTTSYYVINYDYEKYLMHDGALKEFNIKDYDWLEKTNERISKEALSIILRSERVVRNKIADLYSFYCKDNGLKYFTPDSFNVDVGDFIDGTGDIEKNRIKTRFIEDCWKLYRKKKKFLDSKYHFNNINDVPPFVIAQHLTFGQIRTFFKLLKKQIKEQIVSDFNLKISEFNSLIERLNFLRNACAHGEFILDYETLKGKKISNDIYHNYIYNPKYILNKHKLSLIPVLSMCSYLLNDNIKFFISTMRNIMEISHYTKKGSINSQLLYQKMGLKVDSKIVQSDFVK